MIKLVMSLAINTKEYQTENENNTVCVCFAEFYTYTNTEKV